MRNKRRLRVACLSMSLVVFPTGCQVPAGHIPITQIIAGPQIIQQHPESIVRDYVIQDLATWEALWPKISSNPVTPNIDFQSDMVVGRVAAFMNGGSSLRILNVENDMDKINVNVEVATLGTNCMTMQMLSYPYHFVRIPRSSLPVTFHSIQVTKNCN